VSERSKDRDARELYEMSMFVNVSATVRVNITVLAEDAESGLARVLERLPKFRFILPGLQGSCWTHRLFRSLCDEKELPIDGIVSAIVTSSVYAGGE
jgi:hypothetical protein